MKFFVLGDSWALGEFRLQNNLIQRVPNTGLAYWLQQLGHDVQNIAEHSANNYGQLRHARTCFEAGACADYIVWFHGEPSRDAITTYLDDELDGPQQYPDLESYTFDQGMQYIQRRNFEFAQSIFEQYHVPFIVIGGSARLDPAVNNFDFHALIIENWCDEILENKHTQAWNFLNYAGSERALELFKRNSTQQVIEEIGRSRALTQLTKNSKEFGDGYHPVDRHHYALAQRILNHVGSA